MYCVRQFPFLLGIIICFSISLSDAIHSLDLDQVAFRSKVQDSLQAVGRILNNTRHPVLLEDAHHHTYNDKYAMVDTMTNTMVASIISVLKKIGLSDETLVQIVKAVHENKKPVSLHFHMDQTCEFIQETKRKVIRSEMDTGSTMNGGTGLIGRLASSAKVNIQVKATVQDYEWKLRTPYRIYLKIGRDEEIGLQNRSDMETKIVLLGSVNNRQSNRRPGAPLTSTVHDLSVNLTWLFQQTVVGGKGLLSSEFSVDRQSEACKTPRRNAEMEKAFQFRRNYEAWAAKVAGIFEHLERIAPDNNNDRRPTSPEERNSFQDMMFSPILPLFEGSSVLPNVDIDLFLSNHDESMDDFVHSVGARYSKDGYISKKDMILTGLLSHLGELMESWAESVNYVEDLLRTQLVQAIGKELSPQDFDRFMSHYSKQILSPKFAPTPFSYAVRRGEQFPDGAISIEKQNGEGLVETLVRHIPGSDSNPPISLAVDAATLINLQGDRFLHGWIQNRWGMDRRCGMDRDSWKRNLVVRANQFSSFLVILGVMNGPHNFLPKDAIIVQNKDKVLIPLLTDTLPSSKEFQDSISSLSPEQRAFAEVYRKMQLESSLFAICVVQIKPQLEKLLNLPDGALTKEIQLTQDLMTLFADYQIPSDLLSFNGSKNSNNNGDKTVEYSLEEKVETVRKYAASVLVTLERAKDEELDEAMKRAKLQKSMEGDASWTNGQTFSQVAQSSAVQQSPSVPSIQSGRRKPIKLSGYSTQGSTQGYLPAWMVADDQADSILTSPSRSLPNQDQSHQPPSIAFLSRQKTSSSFDDFTLVPSILDSKFVQMDQDGALKSTIVRTSKSWERSRQPFMGWEQNERILLSENQLNMEKSKAMDLLVAISRSGSLPIECCELHVLVTVSHCFEKQIMETIIEDNINPIEKVTKSMSMIASVIHDTNASLVEEERGEPEGTPGSLEKRKSGNFN